MNKGELVKLICEKSSYDMTQKCAAEALDNAFAAIIKAVSKGDNVQFVGFGTFSQGKRSARTVTTPSGDKVKVAAKKTVKFRAGKAFKDAVAGKAAAKKAPAKKTPAKKPAAKAKAKRK